MSGIIESYKKVYENKKIHIWLFAVALIWTICSTAIDIMLKSPNSLKQNPIDLLFNIIIGAYSLQFLHNAIHNVNNGILPQFKEINLKIFWGMIKLNIIWGAYAVIGIIASALLYISSHILFLPVIIGIIMLFISVFVYYIYLAFAEDFNSKGLSNITLIFRLIKPTFKPLYIKLILFILINLAATIIYILIYTIAELTGIYQIGYITDDFYLIDLILNTFAGYFVIVSWYFAFPYSLINSYNKHARPVLRKDIYNGEND